MKPMATLSKTTRKTLVIVNYVFLVIMNGCFYLVSGNSDMTHLVDAVGLTALILVLVTFLPLHWKTGFWKLTHARTAALDERELQLTHTALRHAYAWFTVTCLVIVLAHAVLFRLVGDTSFVITVPLAGSLIYLAHTLPGSVLAWTEPMTPEETA